MSQPSDSTPHGSSAAALNAKEQKFLLRLARQALEAHVGGKPLPERPSQPRVLHELRGAFVTLRSGSDLRGCIGYVQPRQPLGEAVIDMAGAAALRDPRFPPVTPQELSNLHLEISVLSPLRRITDVEEIEFGVHGLYLRKEERAGLLLPQVPLAWGWDREEFLEHTCFKAGLPADAWRTGAAIEVFTAQVFGEPERSTA